MLKNFIALVMLSLLSFCVYANKNAIYLDCYTLGCPELNGNTVGLTNTEITHFRKIKGEIRKEVVEYTSQEGNDYHHKHVDEKENLHVIKVSKIKFSEADYRYTRDL